MRFVVARLFLWLVALLLFCSCQSRSQPAQGVVVFLVEDMGPDSVPCRLKSASDTLMNELCAHAVTSTRTFAPSLSHQGLLTSLLAGSSSAGNAGGFSSEKYIPASLETLAEFAAKRGYRTGLFSGGSPLFHNFSWSQGFERLSHPKKGLKLLFSRTFEKTLLEMESWLDNEVEKAPFFSILYAPSSRPKKSDKSLEEDGKIGGFLHKESQGEIHNVFAKFILRMKHRPQWKNTTFVFLGLPKPARAGDLSVKNLNIVFEVLSPNLQHSRSLGLNLSVADVSKSLRELISNSLEAFSQSLQSHSSLVFSRSSGRISQNHRDLPPVAYQLGRHSLQFRPRLKVFDTFSDSEEKFPLSLDEVFLIPNLKKVREHLGKYVGVRCYSEQLKSDDRPFSKIPSCSSKNSFGVIEISELIELRQAYESSDENLAEVFWQIYRKKGNSIKHKFIGHWLSSYYLKTLNWVQLSKMNLKDLSPSMVYVLWKNRGNSIDESSGCLKYFSDTEKPIRDFYRFCDDNSLLKVIDGLRALKASKDPSRSFWSEVQNIKNQRYAKNANFLSGLSMEVADSLDFSASPAELYFYLPQYSKFRHLVKVDNP